MSLDTCYSSMLGTSIG